MNWFKILSKGEKAEIESELNKRFGIEKVPGIIVKKGKEKLFLFTGSLNKRQIKDLEREIPIERIGIYFAKMEQGGIRLSIEGVQIIKDQVKKNIFELDEKQAEHWMKGNELNISTGKKGFLVMKYKDNFLGSGKASAEKIGNFIPKSRRLKQKS